MARGSGCEKNEQAQSRAVGAPLAEGQLMCLLSTPSEPVICDGGCGLALCPQRYEGLPIPFVGSIWRPFAPKDVQYVKVLAYANGFVTIERHRNKTMSLKRFHQTYGFDRDKA
jgi:hypothetical protein